MPSSPLQDFILISFNLQHPARQALVSFDTDKPCSRGRGNSSPKLVGVLRCVGKGMQVPISTLNYSLLSADAAVSRLQNQRHPLLGVGVSQSCKSSPLIGFFFEHANDLTLL